MVEEGLVTFNRHDEVLRCKQIKLILMNAVEANENCFVDNTGELSQSCYS